MTIKEIEKLTGISKANIRFYESEGLITPNRQENGYRTYDEHHVDELKRIRLFRALDIPIDTLKELSDGTITLSDALVSRKEHFTHQQDHLSQVINVIERMLDIGEGYTSVDVDVYTQMLEHGEIDTVNQDVNPKLNLPWRRFWARMLDFALYNLLLFLLLPDLFGNKSLILLRFGLGLFLFVVAETFMLALLGTTPGKAVFGISVTNLEGKRLSIRDAFERTALVALHGVGFKLPFLAQYLQWKSLKMLENGEELNWECESEVNFRNAANWRYLLFAVLMIPATLYPILNGLEIEPHKQEQNQSQVQEQMQIPSEIEFYAMRNSYRVKEVLYSADNQYDLAELPIVVLNESVLSFSYKGSSPRDGTEEIGVFVQVPTEENSNASVWELETDSNTVYRFCVEDGSYILDCYEKQIHRYSWNLAEAEVLKVRLYSEHSQRPRYPSWWHTDTFDWSLVGNDATHLRYSISMALIFPEGEQPTEITIQEDFYVGNEMTVRHHSAVADENGQLIFDVPLPELEEECYSIFRIPYEGGEYIICFTYEPGEEAWDAFIYDL